MKKMNYFVSDILITIALVGTITASLGRLLGDMGIGGNFVIALIFIVI